MSKDSGKTEALTTAPRDKEEALITAPRDKIEALTTAPRPSEGGIPGPCPKADKSDEKKKDEGGPSGTVPESTLASRHEEVKEEWSTTLQELVRSQQATSGVGTMLHDAEVNRRLLWSRLTRFDVQVMDASLTARRMEEYVTETCQELRKEMVRMQTQVKDGLARALSVETSIGAQDAELARVTAALEALREHGGGKANNENPTGTTASSSAAADTP